MPAGWGFAPVEPSTDAVAGAAEGETLSGVDWAQMLELATELDRPLSEEELALWKRGLLDGNARMWNVDYVHATQSAIEKREPAQLMAMMNAGIPAPAFLLPAISRIAMPTGGRPIALTALEDRVIRSAFERMLALGFTESNAKRQLAERRGLSQKTIGRSLIRSAD